MFSQFSIALKVGLTAVSFLWVAPTVWAHAYPAVSIPGDGATLKEPPREVRIQFTEAIEIAFSKITVKGASGDVFTGGKLRKLADDTLAVDLKPLRAGSYTIEWQVLSVDTHVTEGTLRFTLATAEK
jgi:methionine-rich copper-binding protein CopC